MIKRKLETCFSPALYEPAEHVDSIVVIIDILRASSAIVTAFANGAAEITISYSGKKLKVPVVVKVKP